MHLKKLILSGFKSFADKIVLNFEEGITGVVGPNGSGKSNVIDAVRWVMGEQNAKQLRGEVATDIIFSGSSKRKQLAMAEVTLVFDNSKMSDFCPPELRHEPEISISRRLYIDGQREYLLNRKNCRLKDIIGFFATTGLGGRSYSMIQQGQVDRILNAKPEDVREILEEAAGTLIFKTRRNAAQKKLLATGENLARIDDIITEIHRQLETLKSQVEKAEKWQSLSQGLKDEEMNLLGFHYEKAKNDLKAIIEGINSDSNQEVELMARLAKTEARHESLHSTLNESDPELEVLREKVTQLREIIARNEAALSSAGVLMESGQNKLSLLTEQVGEDQQELQKLEIYLETSQTELNRLGENRSDAVDQQESLSIEVDTINESAQVFDSRKMEISDEINSLDRLLESNSLRCEAIQRDRSHITRDLVTNQDRTQSLKADLEVLSTQLAEAQTHASQIQAGLDKEIMAKQELENQISQKKENLNNLSATRDMHKECYLEAKASIAAYEKSKNQFSTIGQTYDKLTQKMDNHTEVVMGIFADFISFQPNFKQLPATTIAALEGWIERLVVYGYNDLDRLVKSIQQHKLGKLPVIVLETFLAAPLDRESVRNWCEHYDSESLSGYLQIKNEHAQLEQVISRIYHLPVISLTQQDRQAIPPGCLVITAGGIVLSGEFDLSVGVNSEQGILQRKEKVKENQSKLKEAEKQLAQSQNQMDISLQVLNEDRLKIADLEQALSEQNHDVIEVISQVQSLTNQMQHKKEIYQELNTRGQDLQSRDRQLVVELEKMGESRISLAQDHEVLKSDLAELTEEFSKIDERREETQRTYQSKQAEIARIDSKIAVASERQHMQQSQLEKLQLSLSKKYQENQKIEHEILMAGEEQTQLKNEIGKCISEREQIEKLYAAKQESNADTLKQIRLVEEQLKKLREEQLEFHKQRNNRDVKKEGIAKQMDSLTQQAMEKFSIDLETIESKPSKDFQPAEAQRKIKNFRVEIDQLGAINMVAIEEYGKLSERHEFISAQREEVSSSILLLEDAIGEIEEASRERFLKSFEVVNRNFTELFPILFPDGEARLDLVADKDPLEAGVEIMVRMPGKKQQSMNLYSGGEKALTAISLIFALLKTKPTPFCFLDEVDAPLDEVNVGRYNRVLESLSSKFQFIVITHNRRTMEVLDQLYGVTMQEGGVSTVVGVDMRKDIPAHLKKAFKQSPNNRSIEGASAT